MSVPQPPHHHYLLLHCLPPGLSDDVNWCAEIHVASDGLIGLTDYAHVLELKHYLAYSRKHDPRHHCRQIHDLLDDEHADGLPYSLADMEVVERTDL